MLGEHTLWQYAHILLFVYWLGADLGVFFASRYVARGDLSLDERLRFLDLLLRIDMGPRTALILMIPVGFELATGLGLLQGLVPWLWAIWIAALAWLALAWWLFFRARDPAARPLAVLDEWIRRLVIVTFLLLGAASLATGAPVEARWLALKLLLFAGVVTLGLILRGVIRDWVRGFAQLRVPAQVDDGNALIAGAHRRATRYAHGLWLLVMLIAFLGVTKPLLGQ